MTTNTRNTLIICAVMALCSFFIIAAIRWPAWQLEWTNQATRELFGIQERGGKLEDLQRWSRSHRDHFLAPKVRLIVMRNEHAGKYADSAKELDEMLSELSSETVK